MTNENKAPERLQYTMPREPGFYESREVTYIREDVAHAMVAAAYEAAASLPKQVYDNVVDREHIRSLTFDDARAALDKMLAEARREGE